MTKKLFRYAVVDFGRVGAQAAPSEDP